MLKPFEDTAPTEQILSGKSVEDLLLLIADSDKGYKPEAMEMLLSMGLETNYQVFEQAVRNDDDADLRNGAMDVLVSFGLEAIPKLMKLLEDENEQVRNFSAVMLGDIGRREAVEALIRALSDEDMNVRHAVAEALGKIGDQTAIPPLVNSLKCDFWLQFAAITALGNIGDHQAAPHLLEILENEIWSEPVIDALCKIGDPRSLKPLADLLPQLDDNLGASVTKAIVSIYQRLNESLRFKNSLVEYNKAELKDIISSDGIQKIRKLLATSNEQETVEAAVILLGWLGEAEAIDDFFKLLKDAKFARTVEGAVFSIGMPAVPYLQNALSHESSDVKIVALHSLRWLGETPQSERLAELLTHDDPAVQIEALDSLAGIPVETHLQRVIELFEQGSEEVCAKSVEVLAACPFDLILDHLSSMTTSGDAEIRRRAAVILGSLDEDKGIIFIEALITDGDVRVRKEAIRAAGMRKIEALLPMIQQALADPDPGIKETAVIALAGFSEAADFMNDVLPLLGMHGEALDYAVIKAVGTARYEKAGSVLTEYLRSTLLPSNLIYAILETLGVLSYKPASELIISHYLHHQDLDIRRMTVEVLGSFSDQDSLRELESAVHDPHWSVRISALKALEKCSGPRATQLLLNALNDRDPLVKKHAITALGSLRDVKTVSEIVKQLADNEMKEFACEAILNFGRSALPYLHRIIRKEGTGEIKERVIELIGKIGEHSSTGPLMELLDDPNQNIRLAAIDSLAFCFDSVPLKRLINTRNNDSSDEVKSRADLAIKTFLLESYS